MKKMFRKIWRYATKWICPNCGCEKTYGGEGAMKCPKCGKWMQEE